jgi:predicted Zn-dependent peptidase
LHRRTVLDNGIRIVTEKLPQFHSVSTGLWVNVGSRDEQAGERGYTHIIEHMLFKGTERRSSLDIAKELDGVGGFANAFTTKEQMCLHAKVLDSHLPLVVDILTDILMNSVFDPAEIDRERQVILQEISMVEDTPDDYIHVLHQEKHWKDNPLGYPIYGTAESVLGATRESLFGYMQRTFDPADVVVAAAGNVDHERFVDLVAPRMTNFNGSRLKLPRQPPDSHHVVDIIPKTLEQVHVCLGWKGCSSLDGNRFACHLLNVLLGGSMSSRLFQEIREKRALAYSVYSFVNSHVDTGMMGVYAGTGVSQIQETLDIVGEELVRLTQEPIGEVELRAAKEHFKGSMYLNAESNDSRMHRLSKNEFLFGRYVPFEEVEAKIEQTTSEAIQDWFSSVFRKHEQTLVLLGPVEPGALDVSGYL